MTLLKVITAVVMIISTFGVKPYKQLFKRLFFLFAITFVFGGFSLAIYMFFDKDILIYSNGIIYFDVDMTFLAIISVISYIIISFITKFTDKKAPKSKEYMVSIENNNKIITQKALMDTGNNLRDPFSSHPVILVDKQIFDTLFIEDKIRLIPTSTVSGESLLRAFKPQRITINDYSTDAVYIGESLSPLDDYKIILNINLEGEMHNE